MGGRNCGSGRIQMNHFDEETLELFILNAKEVGNQRGEIEKHLKVCAGCRSLHEEISSYYDEVRKVQKELPAPQTGGLTIRSMRRDLPGITGQKDLYRPGTSFPGRLVFAAIRYPGRTFACALILLGTVFGLGTLVSPGKDINPSYARAQQEFLVVYDKEGKELWKKHVGEGYDGTTMLGSHGYKAHRYLQAVDVDRDGVNEIIAVFGAGRWAFDQNAVYCFDAQGVEKWKCVFGRKMTFGTRQFLERYAVTQMLVKDMNNDGYPEVFVVAQCESYYPTAVLRLTGQTGTLEAEYWHSGYFRLIDSWDVDGNGTPELILSGENNGLNSAVLVILDPNIMNGHSPTPPRYTPAGIPPGSEKYYILFPHSDLTSIAGKRNVAIDIKSEDGGGLRVTVNENVVIDRRAFDCALLYHFDSTLSVKKVLASDFYRAIHMQLEVQGKVTRHPDDRYLDSIGQCVRYWDGEKFVNESTINTLFVKAQALLP